MVDFLWPPIAPISVSIVVINYNNGEFLTEAVECALAQSRPALEVIVVDDGSTDGSAALIHAFGARVIPVLKTNGGHISAANAGFAASQGEIVIFTDSDDRLRADCVAEVSRHWRPGLAKLQYRLATVDRHGRDQHMDFPYYAPDLTPSVVHAQAMRSGFYGWPVSSGNAFARDFLLQLMPIDKRFLHPDGYLNKLAPLFGEVASLSMILADYRVHGRNIWAQDGSAGLRTAGISRAVRCDVMLQDDFARRAVARGLNVPPYRRCPHVKTLEYRMLSLRLAPAEHPVGDDGRWGVMWLGLRAIRGEVNINRFGRLIWAAWFVAMAAMPAPWLARVFPGTRGQSQRPAWSRWLVGMSRGLASPY